MKIWLQLNLRNMQASTYGKCSGEADSLFKISFPAKVFNVCHAHVLCLWCAIWRM